jgi:hypothetical protein
VSLPKPAHWKDRPTTSALGALAFAAGVGAVCLIWAVGAIRRADYITAIAMFGLAMFMVALLSVVLISRLGWVSFRGNFDCEGTVLRVDSRISMLFIAGMAFLISTSVVFAVFGPFGAIDIPMAGRQTIAIPIGMAIVGIIALTGLMRAVFLGGLGSVRLTPDGFAVATMFSTEEGRWSDVVELTDETADRRAYLPIVIVMKDGSSRVIKPANSYTSYGRGLYWMVRHYWLHPEHRDELTDGRALDRLRCEQFDVDS